MGLVWYALLYIHSSFSIILTKTRELVTLLLLSFGCLITVNQCAVAWSVVRDCGISKSYPFTVSLLTFNMVE